MIAGIRERTVAERWAKHLRLGGTTHLWGISITSVI